MQVGQRQPADQVDALLEVRLALTREAGDDIRAKTGVGKRERESLDNPREQIRPVGASHRAQDGGRTALQRDVQVRQMAGAAASSSSSWGVNSGGSTEESRSRARPGIAIRRVRRPARVCGGARSRPQAPRCTPVSTISR